MNDLENMNLNKKNFTFEAQERVFGATRIMSFGLANPDTPLRAD
jgi:hypothetical protein